MAATLDVGQFIFIATQKTSSFFSFPSINSFTFIIIIIITQSVSFLQNTLKGEKGEREKNEQNNM